MNAPPAEWLEPLELRDVITALALDFDAFKVRATGESGTKRWDWLKGLQASRWQIGCKGALMDAPRKWA